MSATVHISPVTCRGCPLAGRGPVCRHPRAPDKNYLPIWLFREPPPPGWCPLPDAPIIIERPR